MQDIQQNVLKYMDSEFIQKYAKQHEIAEDESAMIFHEMKKFLIVCSKGDNLTPSRHIDKMWHEYILHSKKYEELSKKLGKFVHHIPMNEFDVEGYNRAQDKIIMKFGSINKNVWPEVKTKSAGCCYGDCSM